MKNLLLGAAALFLMASCSGNGTTEKTNEDSTRIADSIAQVEAAQAAAEQARQDSIRQDSIAKAEAQAKTAQYDDLVDQYVALVNKLDKEARSGNFNNIDSKVRKICNLEAKIRKVKNNLSPEQLTKYKKAISMMGELGNGIIAG